MLIEKYKKYLRCHVENLINMNILQEKKFPSIQKTVMQQAKFMYYSL